MDQDDGRHKLVTEFNATAELPRKLPTASADGLAGDHRYSALPLRMPSYDDHAPFGVNLFRLGVWDDEWPNLTLPRTFICRSEVSRFSFRNTDFSESRFCWNDFEDVDFTDADLCDCDLRSSLFRNVKFVRANLSGADLRLSEYTDCDFSGAFLKGTKLTHAQGQILPLTEKQRAEIDWQDEDGEEPGGG